jgi:hypothetical protein
MGVPDMIPEGGLLFGFNIITVNPSLITGNDIFQRFSSSFAFWWRFLIVAVSDLQSRILAYVLLRPDALLNLPLKLCAESQWVFQQLLQLLSQQFPRIIFPNGQSGFRTHKSKVCEIAHYHQLKYFRF